MNIPEFIETNKDKILPVLFEWAETFDCEVDEDGERTLKPYEEVFSLAKRLENNQCDKNDFENILFHIEQINYNEIKIAI